MTPSMSLNDALSIAPLFLLLIGAIVVLLLESFSQKFSARFSTFLTFLTLSLALSSSHFTSDQNNPLLSHWLRFDSLSLYLTGLFLTISLITTALSAAFFKRCAASYGEYYFLLLSATFGLVLIGASADFLTLFLGLEILSLSVYVLCAYIKRWTLSHEASLKYFLTGSLGAAFLLYGIALIYGATGSTHFSALHSIYSHFEDSISKTLFLMGVAFVTAGLAFKIALVPFHAWAPDVYEGSPTPVTAFMAVGVKAGAVAAFIRVFIDGLPQFNILWSQVMAVGVMMTLLYANFAALRQTQLRRFFAYSGISNAGFLLIPIITGGPDALSSLLFYLVIYSFATLGIFALLINLDEKNEGLLLKDLKGLFYRSPIQAILLAFCLITLAGLPPTAGFIAKFYLFKTAFEAGYQSLVLVGLLSTILSAYYYLRIISMTLSVSEKEIERPNLLVQATFIGVFASLSLFAFALYPEPMITHHILMKK